ncbi:4-hydroxybenzoate solanesyltransferase [Gloeocapsa sp. PCC 73106]|uniref:4-hydroxybenzoate solanesyltransferase n=1 Tax=Gloeocapsa sp. PCC 73106 TaxID=102232 RepID=UPI001566EE3F|nr:4-hydroxybenzoate solanesyltransferase [Gloeocapsa sp. PCC 73106]
MMVSTPQSQPTWLTIVKLLRWDKPAGRLILMIPALWALFLAARGIPPIPLLIVIILGSLATSAAGCVINDLWDRDIDKEVARTKDRPLAARSLSITTGIVITLIAMACAAVLAFYLNPLTFALAVAAVPVIVVYPLAKRFFPIPQLVLSLAWGFAVLISWSAVTANLSSATWVLWGATVSWTLGFDTVYAMSDREDDERIGINSSARFFGDYAPEAVGLFFLITTVLLVYLGVLLGLGWSYRLSLVLSAIAWLSQYRLLRQPQLPRETYALIFRQNVGIGFILLAGMIVSLLFAVG